MNRLTRLRVSPPVNWLRYHLYRDILLTRPRRIQCNICGWAGRRFLTYKHRNVLCPQCGSHVRQRLIAAALEWSDTVRGTVRVEGSSLLHVSPEYCLGLVFRPRAAEYVRADHATADCDLRVDMTDMRAVPDGRFDLVVACDVLEHINDDRAAIRETWRVLRPRGTAILTVPQFDHDERTLEDPAIVSQEDRARVYGQEDHLRNYGADLAARLEEAGFSVIVVSAADFDEALVCRHTLRPPVPLNAPYGWNDRRIYFATK